MITKNETIITKKQYVFLRKQCAEKSLAELIREKLPQLVQEY